MPVLDPDPIYFRESLESVLGQTLERIEVIVVEDPSMRTARDVIESLKDPRIRYYANRERTSGVQQRNLGLAEARAEFVAIQDADDIAEKDRLEKQLDFLRTHPTVGVLGTQIQVIDAKGKHLGYRCYPQENDAIVHAMQMFNPIAHPTVMFRKQTILTAGGYQYLTHTTEDYELWSRLALREVRFANHPEVLLRYRVHVEGTKTRKLHDTIRGTLDIKRMYWLGTMDLKAKARMYGEYLLLWLPASFVLGLFLRTQLSRKYPC